MSEGDSGESKQTTDHETIKNWAEERDGHPATVRDTVESGEESRFFEFVTRD